MTIHLRGYKNFDGIARVEMNGKGTDILFRVLWHVHDTLLPRAKYKPIFSPSDSDLHASMPLAPYGDTAYERSTAPVWFDAMAAVTVDGKSGYSNIGVVQSRQLNASVVCARTSGQRKYKKRNRSPRFQSHENSISLLTALN
jgi:hypothetical protein